MRRRTVRVGTAHINLLDLVNQLQTRTRMANCTHVDMDRVYGRDQCCYVCGNPPSIGFLYECRQDSDTESLRDTLLPKEECVGVSKSDLRLELEEAGLSESVILTAELGDYTAAHLNLLKKQKHDLKQIIAHALQGIQIHNTVTRLATVPSNHDGALSSMPTKDACPPACNFRACVTCRPYFRDRSFISFQDVLSANFAPVTAVDMQRLPTKSAHVMRTIGMTAHGQHTSFHHVSASSSGAPQTASTTSDCSELTFKTTQTDLDEMRAQRRPRRRFYKIGHRSSGDIARDLNRLPPLLTPHGLKTAIQGIFHPSRESSSEGSNITLPLPRTGTARKLEDGEIVGEFDMGALRRVRRQKERNEVKNGTFVGGFEDVGASATHGSFASVAWHAGDKDGVEETETSDSSELSLYSCVSESSEMEVNGDEEEEEEEDAEAGLDVSLQQSIMTQR